MTVTEESKILIAIAQLETNYKHLDEDMKGLSIKIDECMSSNAECNQKNFKYMISTLLASITALFGWALFLEGVI